MGVTKAAQLKCCFNIDIHDFVEGLEGSFVHGSKNGVARGIIYKDIDGPVFFNGLFNQKG